MKYKDYKELKKFDKLWGKKPQCPQYQMEDMKSDCSHCILTRLNNGVTPVLYDVGIKSEGDKDTCWGTTKKFITKYEKDLMIKEIEKL